MSDRRLQETVSHSLLVISLNSLVIADWWGFEIAVTRVCEKLTAGTPFESSRLATVKGTGVRFYDDSVGNC